MSISNKALREFAESHGREFVQYCKWPFNPKNVLWGECHGDRYDINPQIEFIERFGPSVVLHELMGIHVYDPRTGLRTLRRLEGDVIGVREDAREEINQVFIRLADRYGFLLVGCDLTVGEREYIIETRGGRHQTEDQIRRKLEEMRRPVGPFGVNVLDLAEFERHKEMADVYKQYREDYGLVLKITGLQHVRGENKPDWEASDLHSLVGRPDYGVIENRLNARVEARELVMA